MLVSETTPRKALPRLAASAASGELIVAAQAFEVHVYLLDGRVAWATSSSAPNAFARYIVEHCGLGPEVLREAVEECRRSRAKLGEMLVEWGVLSLEQVREALRAQIVGALATILSAQGEVRSLFLERRLEYAPELTFGLKELLDEDPAATRAAGGEELLDQVAAALPGTLWVATVREGRIDARRPAMSDIPEWITSAVTAKEGEVTAEAVVVRSAYGTIVGQALQGGGASVWCGLPAHARFGLASSVLAALGTSPAPRPPPRERSGGPWQWQTALPSDALRETLETALQTAEELLGLTLLDAQGGTRAQVRRTGCELVDPGALGAGFRALLDGSLAGWFGGTEPHLAYDRIGLSLVSDRSALFATQVTSSPAPSLWLAFEAVVPPGLGWALLNSLARQVGDHVGT